MTKNLIQQFRDAVYQSLLKRPDAVLDLIDALTVAGHVELPVAVSEQAPFRRKFSMVYDILEHAEIDFDALLHTLLIFQPAESETIAGYEVYGLDATKDERPDAETLPERGCLKSQKDEPLTYGHKYSWLVRLVSWGTSWVAPQDTLRIDPGLSDSQVGSQQVQELAQRHPKSKVVVEDSLYGNHVFLAIFLVIQNTFALVRMRSNNVLHEQPAAREPGEKKEPRRSMAPGSSFPARREHQMGKKPSSSALKRSRVQAWKGLHLKKLAALVVMMLRVEFLTADGQPRYKQPMWLLWTGPDPVALAELCKMYLWRFAIEIVFPQMTKTGVFAFWTGRDHVTDLYIFVCDDHPIDQQFHQLPLLLKRSLVQTGLHALAKHFDRSTPSCQFLLLAHLVPQLLFLLDQSLLPFFQFAASALVLGQGNDAVQIGLGQAV